MPDVLAAHDEPPRVTACEGEIVVIGSGFAAAYSVEGARALIRELDAAVATAERQAVRPKLRLV